MYLVSLASFQCPLLNDSNTYNHSDWTCENWPEKFAISTSAVSVGVTGEKNVDKPAENLNSRQ